MYVLWKLAVSWENSPISLWSPAKFSEPTYVDMIGLGERWHLKDSGQFLLMEIDLWETYWTVNKERGQDSN